MSTNNYNTQRIVHRAPELDEQLMAVRVPEGPMPENLKTLRRPTLEEQARMEESDTTSAKSKRRKIVESITNDSEDERVKISLSYFLSGGMLNAQWFRKQKLWMIMVACFIFLYITISYMTQEQMIENKNLREKVEKSNQQAKVSISQLNSSHRQSTIAKRLTVNGDTTFHAPESQPLTINQ